MEDQHNKAMQKLKDNPRSGSSLYDLDFYAWALTNAKLLRAGKFSEADMANIAEELESMGRGEKRELISRLTSLANGGFRPNAAAAVGLQLSFAEAYVNAVKIAEKKPR